MKKNLLKEFIQLTVEGSAEDFDAEMKAQEEARAARWAAEAAKPEVKAILDQINNATDPKELAKAKRAAVKADDAGIISITGVWMKAYNAKKEELANIALDSKALNNPNAAAEHRMDTLLRMRDSSGRAKARKF